MIGLGIAVVLVMLGLVIAARHHVARTPPPALVAPLTAAYAAHLKTPTPSVHDATRASFYGALAAAFAVPVEALEEHARCDRFLGMRYGEHLGEIAASTCRRPRGHEGPCRP